MKEQQVTIYITNASSIVEWGSKPCFAARENEDASVPENYIKAGMGSIIIPEDKALLNIALMQLDKEETRTRANFQQALDEIKERKDNMLALEHLPNATL